MNDLSICRKVLFSLPMCYAVSQLHTPQGCYGVCASEGKGGCQVYEWNAPDGQIPVWQDAGGCMSISQLEADGTFLAVQNFFPGFDAAQACIVRTFPTQEGWKAEKWMAYPYLHRFDIVRVQEKRFLVACQLCKTKAFRDDWSSPGETAIGELDGDRPPREMRPVIPSLTKNHGFCHTVHNGHEVLLIAGSEGLYEVAVPKCPDDPWQAVRLLEREISDAVTVDLDGDGEDELVTIEGFHGDEIAVNKLCGSQWQIVYRFSAPFAHALWGGNILGRPGLLAAYRGGDGALLLLRKPEEGWQMQHTVIDRFVAPTNLSVTSGRDACVIDASCGKVQQLVRYTLSLD
ncbi:MAG TPA: hypothetical protein IAC11_00790 [Candidatus Limiplasma pullicola]|nr:hypothetical protein [Candidatus Limiplasma pullicola]